MKTWAVVPVKSFEKAKTRLAGVLDDETRRSLSEWLLVRTLDVLRSVPAVETTVVVSADPQALVLARRCGALALDEGLPSGLNPAVARATDVASTQGAQRVLVLPADLPVVERADIEALVAAAPPPPSLVLAPDRQHSGTNAMLVAPPGLIEYAFGTESFARHRKLAQAAGARVVVCERPGLGLDLDGPPDLALLPEQVVAAARQRLRE